MPNTISFGFATGQASSAFVASPGQTFYAPVTLTILPGTVMDSLQFNLTVNSAGPSPGPAITPGMFGFQSMLMKPNLADPPTLMVIPPYMFINNAVNPPPPGQIVYWCGTNFINLVTTDLSLNLLGVGWLERQGQTNLFNTLSQNLITISIAHDDLFPNAAQPNGVIVGGYSFHVPANAVPGNTYQIQIGRPSATTDGIGAPGSSVFIYTPTNGSLSGGAINTVKNVTVGQRKYIAGDAAPFRWFNAGDFGDTNLDASDVAQVFESAIYGLIYNWKAATSSTAWIPAATLMLITAMVICRIPGSSPIRTLCGTATTRPLIQSPLATAIWMLRRICHLPPFVGYEPGVVPSFLDQ